MAEDGDVIVEGAKGPSSFLPETGTASVPRADAEFSIDSTQIGKKLGKHVENFGGSAANAENREMVLNKINDIGNNPDEVIPGTFAGQRVGITRSDIFFRIKGDDVVVTKPEGSFVKILKDGVTQSSPVKSAIEEQ